MATRKSPSSSARSGAAKGPKRTTGHLPPPSEPPPQAWEPVAGPAPVKVPPDPAAERQWAMFAHLAAFAGLLVSFGNLLGPLVVWLVKRRESTFVDEHGKAALNFQILISVASLVLFVFIFFSMGFGTLWVGTAAPPTSIFEVLAGVWPLILAFIALQVLAYVFAALGAIAANRGERYRYPFSLPIVR